MGDPVKLNLHVISSAPRKKKIKQVIGENKKDCQLRLKYQVLYYIALFSRDS